MENSRQLEQRGAFEDGLAKRLQALIAVALGPGHAAVTVSADLDFDVNHTESVTNKAPAGGKLPTDATTTNETYKGSNPSTGGVLGPNVTPVVPGATNGTDYSKKDAAIKYAVNQVRSEIDKAPGSIKGISVAALFDSKKVASSDVAKWTQTISAAAGISKTRGDVVSVNLVPFDTTAAKAAEAQVKDAQSVKSQDFLLNLLRYIVTLLIVGVVLFLAWRSVKRASVASGPVRVPLDLRELEAGDLVGGRSDAAYEAARQLAAQNTRRVPIESSHSQLEMELNELIERQPDEVAQTLRSWLADRRS
jgi:flagellar M-ring protein FliF